MKETLGRSVGFFKATALGGVLFLLPLAVVLGLLGYVYSFVVVVYEPLQKLLPVDSAAGIAVLFAAAVGILLLLCFVAGLAAHRAIGRRFSQLVEKYLNTFFPKYAIYKDLLAGNIGGTFNVPSLKPVLVSQAGQQRIAFESDRLASGRVMVYFPVLRMPGLDTLGWWNLTMSRRSNFPLTRWLACWNNWAEVLRRTWKMTDRNRGDGPANSGRRRGRSSAGRRIASAAATCHHFLIGNFPDKISRRNTMMKRIRFAVVIAAVLTGSGNGYAQDQSAELKLFQGRWTVTELVEDGKVVSADLIRSALPSGGKVEIIDNAIVFQSPDDQQMRAKTFSIDAARYPKTLDINIGDTKDGLAIYRFDGSRLVICAVNPADGERPDDFAAAAGSKRMLLVLERAAAGVTPPGKSGALAGAPQPKPATSDDALRASLIGIWRYTDSIGALIVTLNSNGTYSTTREVKELRLFQTVFVNTPVSNGTWTAQKGQLLFHITGANDPARLHLTASFSIRSVSPVDFIAVDSLGRVAKATRIR